MTQPDGIKTEGKQAPTVTGKTEPGIVLGTAGYMSPEQASGAAVDFRSDQFALGAILYEMATGRRAFQGDSDRHARRRSSDEEPESIAGGQPQDPDAASLDRRAVSRQGAP